MRQLIILACTLLDACTTLPHGDALQTLIDHNVRAMGGRAAIESVRSIEFGIEIVEPTFSVRGHYIADRAGRMRIDIYADGRRVFTEAFDGRHAWQMGQDGAAQAAGAAGTAALRHGTQFPGRILGLHEMAAHGHRLDTAGRERVDGVNYHVIKLAYDDGFGTYLYLNPETWLIERQRDLRAPHPDMDAKEKWIEARSTDFRPVDGVLRPFSGSQVDLRTGNVLQTTRVLWVRTNTDPDPALFEFGRLRDGPDPEMRDETRK